MIEEVEEESINKQESATEQEDDIIFYENYNYDIFIHHSDLLCSSNSFVQYVLMVNLVEFEYDKDYTNNNPHEFDSELINLLDLMVKL